MHVFSIRYLFRAKVIVLVFGAACVFGLGSEVINAQNQAEPQPFVLDVQTHPKGGHTYWLKPAPGYLEREGEDGYGYNFVYGSINTNERFGSLVFQMETDKGDPVLSTEKDKSVTVLAGKRPSVKFPAYTMITTGEEHNGLVFESAFVKIPIAEFEGIFAGSDDLIEVRFGSLKRMVSGAALASFRKMIAESKKRTSAK